MHVHAGIDVRTSRAERGAYIDVSEFDAVLVGASVHNSRHQSDMRDWLNEHHESLLNVRSAFFSVSLTAAEDSDEANRAVAQTISELLESTGFHPTIVQPIAGALRYRKYGVATRVLMRLVAQHKGLPTDTDADVEFTDWDVVNGFADEVALLARDQAPLVSSR